MRIETLYFSLFLSHAPFQYSLPSNLLCLPIQSAWKGGETYSSQNIAASSVRAGLASHYRTQFQFSRASVRFAVIVRTEEIKYPALLYSDQNKKSCKYKFSEAA